MRSLLLKIYGIFLLFWRAQIIAAVDIQEQGGIDSTARRLQTIIGSNAA
jgi:hypothetical protein